MPRYVTTVVPGTECLGDSRTRINNNFENLDTLLNTLSTNTLTLSTTNTVQFVEPFNAATRRIAAFVRPTSINDTHLASDSVTTAKLSAQAVTTDKIAPDTVRYSQLASWQTLSASPTLSAEAVQPRLAKAWVVLNGFNSPYSILSAFNVSSITFISQGIFDVNFAPGTFNDNVYVPVGSVKVDAGPYTYVSDGTLWFTTDTANYTKDKIRVLAGASSTGGLLSFHRINLVMFSF